MHICCLAVKGKEQRGHPAVTTHGHAHTTFPAAELPSSHRDISNAAQHRSLSETVEMSLQRFTPFNTSVRSRPNPTCAASVSTPDLRPACLAESNARRLLKRSQLSKRATREADDEEDTAFPGHEEPALESIAAAATAQAAAVSTSSACPFDSQAIGYSVQCYATYAEDAARLREEATMEKEKLTLFHSINSSRQTEGQEPLRLKTTLSRYAQDHADAITSHTPQSTVPHYLMHSASSRSTAHPNSVVVVMAPSGSRRARLVSPPRIGALACGELWYGGKYRRHMFDMSGKASSQHADDCPCHLRMVFETMVDDGWRAMGIGRAGDGRWVVELGQ